MPEPNLNLILDYADRMLAELPVTQDLPVGDFDLVHVEDFYPPQNKLDDALFSVWCVFTKLQELKRNGRTEEN